METLKPWRKTLVTLSVFTLAVILTACAPQPVVELNTGQLKQLHLQPVTIADVALLPSEQTRVAETVTRILEEQLRQRGYRIGPTAAEGTLSVHIDYVRDQRVHSRRFFERVWPELELYATFKLVDQGGRLLAQDDVIARGYVPDFAEPGTFEYLEPQINLARKISSRFPMR